MSTLYRKYRPQSFSQVIGQNHIKITIQHELEKNEIGHAYLFCGPRGLGKTTLARLFAKSVNCLNRKAGSSEPCNVCQSCLDIVANKSMDVIEIDAASHTGVDNVRENIIENARFTPVNSKYKVFIIDEVHMLSTSAFNALLKTLEEPPAHAIFILCTTEIHKLPQTIISRCQRFDLKKIQTAEMVNRLAYIVKEEKKEVEEEVLRNVAIHAEGCARDAESLLGKILTLGDKIDMEQAEIVLPRSDWGRVIEFVDFLIEKNAAAAIELINSLVDDGYDLIVFMDELLEFLRTVMLSKSSEKLIDFGLELDEEKAKALGRLGEKMNFSELVSMIELFLEKQKDLKTAFIPQFPFELAAIELCEDIVCKKNDPLTSGNITPTKVKEIIKAQLVKEPEVISEMKPEVKSETIVKTEMAPEIVDQPAETEVETVKSAVEPCEVNFQVVKENWGRIVSALAEKNYSLSSMLKVSELVGCKGNQLEIAVSSAFYKERLESINGTKVVQEVIKELLGFSPVIKGVVSDKLKSFETSSDYGTIPNSSAISVSPAQSKSEPLPEIKIEKPQDALGEVMSMF